VQNVFTFNAQGNATPTIPIEVTMTLNTGERIVRVLINGQDANCIWGINTAVLAATGGIGLRTSSNGGGLPRMFVNRLRFESRTGQAVGAWGTDRFQRGNITNSAVTISPAVFTGSQSTHLDMMLMGASFDGYQLRKNAGYGIKADTIDYGPDVGDDLSDSITFEEGVNITDQGTMIAPVSEMYSSSVRVNAVPGGNSGGQITSAPRQAVGTMVLTNTVSDLGLAAFQLLTSYSRDVASRAANVMEAIQVSVIRTPDTADRWRELDFVTVHIPTLGVDRQVVQVMGYTFVEGSPEQTVYLNQYPRHAITQHPVDRIARCLEYISTTYKTR
jgi:hypothetical protein